MPWEHITYQEQDFRDEDWSESELTGCTFDRCGLTGSFAGSRLSRCVFTGGRFRFVDFSSVTAKNCAFLNCVFDEANLFGAVLSHCKCTGSSFSGARTTGLSLEAGSYQYCDLSRLSLAEAELVGASFAHADLRECSLRGADLRYCDFTQALMQGCDLTKADLRGATLAGVEVRALKMKETSIDLPIAVAIAEGMGAKLF